jgi:hypothetical protein
MYHIHVHVCVYMCTYTSLHMSHKAPNVYVPKMSGISDFLRGLQNYSLQDWAKITGWGQKQSGCAINSQFACIGCKHWWGYLELIRNKTTHARPSWPQKGTRQGGMHPDPALPCFARTNPASPQLGRQERGRLPRSPEVLS